VTIDPLMRTHVARPRLLAALRHHLEQLAHLPLGAAVGDAGVGEIFELVRPKVENYGACGPAISPARPTPHKLEEEQPVHQYFDLVYQTAVSTLNALREADNRARQSEPPGNTTMVKTLQAIRLQKAITAVGMFSMFEAILQDGLKCNDGFAEARRCMQVQNETALAERFSHFFAAINVLKHGQGRSYQVLLQASGLPFRIARPNAPLSLEGDITAITALVEVDDQFVLDCARLIQNVSEVVRKLHPSAWGL